MVIVPLPGQLEHRAVAGVAAIVGCAVEIAAAVHDRPAYGYAPLVPLNEASVVIVPLPWATSKTVPSLRSASLTRSCRRDCRCCP